MYIDYEENICLEYNHDEMIDPEEHKTRFLTYCSDPAVPEEELCPYDDYTYPISQIEEV